MFVHVILSNIPATHGAEGYYDFVSVENICERVMVAYET